MEDIKREKVIRTLVVDDSSDFLEVERNFLSMEPYIEIIGEALNGVQSIEMANRLNPDLILMDLALPDINGIEATKKIKEMDNPPLVVILTLYDNPEYRRLAEEAMADGFVTKSEFATNLIPIIRRLFFGQSEGSRKEHKKMAKILVVDDSATMRRMIMAALRPIKGARFNEASNGLEAIEQVALGDIDLITLDLNMPDINGIEVLHFIRQHERFKKIPIIVLTTKSDEASKDTALGAGATLYMTKPFKPDELLKNALKMIQG